MPPVKPSTVEVEIPIPPDAWRALRLRATKTGRSVREEARHYFEGQTNWRGSLRCPNGDYQTWTSRDWNGQGYECPNCASVIRPAFREG